MRAYIILHAMQTIGYKWSSFETGAVALSGAMTDAGTGSIFLDNVQCTGTETRLRDCPANPVGTNDCSHFEDAGVTCVSSKSLNRSVGP